MQPKVVLYAATSLDGRTTGFSADEGMFYSLAQRWGEDATLVGCDTLLSAASEVPEDDGHAIPAAVPGEHDQRPILIVPDSRGRLRSWHYWREQPYWKDFISLCTKSTASDHIAYLSRKGVKTLIAGTDHVDYRQALDELSRQFEVNTVRVDSGGTLNGLLLRAGLVDELHLLVHPTLVGGVDPKTFFRDSNLAQAGEIALRFLRSEPQTGGILLLSYAVTK